MMTVHGDLQMFHRRNRAWRKGKATLLQEKKTRARHESEMATTMNATAWTSV